MWEMIQGAARERLSSRERIDQDTLAFLRSSGTLIVDERRRRPLYFDGRFLAARDLTREQQYFLTRQADLGRATGAGVVHGLMVSVMTDGARLTIGAGHGVTDSGESVILSANVTVPLANVTSVQRLDASFGLSRRPAEPARNRTGLFVVALRPVEFTANPIASYPTSITDPRTVEDGDVVDAVVVSLIPYPEDGTQADLGMRRARAAREIFVQNGARGLPVDALPLAMVLLDRGVVRWLDVFMVRREVGSSHGDVLGFGFAPRAAREAHLVQYDNHLADVLRDRAQASRGQKFAATEHFAALPPAGRMPAAAINLTDFTQSFLPAEVDVELSIVPEDEIPALLEEAILLPPIDLTTTGEALESTSVLVLLPIPRQHVRLVRHALAQAGQPAHVRQLRTAAPGLIAQRRPLEVLQGLRLPRLAERLLPPGNPVDVAWASVVTAASRRNEGTLWFVRRRNLQYRSDVVGAGRRVLGDELAAERNLETRSRTWGLDTALWMIREQASVAAYAEAIALLTTPKLARSRLLTEIAVTELSRNIRLQTTNAGSPIVFANPNTVAAARKVATARAADEASRGAVLHSGVTGTGRGGAPPDSGGDDSPERGARPGDSEPREPPEPEPPMPRISMRDVADISERYATGTLGDGISELEPEIVTAAGKAGSTRYGKLVDAVAQTRIVEQLDRIGDRMRDDEAAMRLFAQALVKTANEETLDEVKKLVEAKLGEVLL